MGKSTINGHFPLLFVSSPEGTNAGCQSLGTQDVAMDWPRRPIEMSMDFPIEKKTSMAQGVSICQRKPDITRW